MFCKITLRTQLSHKNHDIIGANAEQTHNMFLVLLEMGVDKKAPGGIKECILHIVNTLVPTGCQRGGSCGHLVGV